jgi:CheY-like chemotaxis protein
MDGEVNAESEQGKGSTFTASIKLQSGHKTDLEVPEVDLTNVHILVVDDNSTNRLVLQQHLTRQGAIVHCCDSGNSALKLLDEQSTEQLPRIAILDMQMPQMDGATLAKEIRSNQRYCDMSLIMMTSMGSRGDAKRFSDLGFKAYFTKPFAVKDLFDAISLVIAGGEVLDRAQPLVTKYYLKELKHPVKQRPSQQQLAQLNILLVDDNPINQEVLAGQLQRWSLNYQVANNGKEALAVLNEGSCHFNLLLLDCQMPVRDGYETAKAIRIGEAGAKYSDIPIIAMTANTLNGEREKCLAAGMNDYIAKPFVSSDLDSKLNIWLFQSLSIQFEGDSNDHKTVENSNDIERNKMSIDDYSVDPELRQIMDYLLGYDTAAIKALEKVIDRLPDSDARDQLKQTYNYAQKFDFETAAKLIDKAKEQISHE